MHAIYFSESVQFAKIPETTPLTPLDSFLGLSPICCISIVLEPEKREMKGTLFHCSVWQTWLMLMSVLERKMVFRVSSIGITLILVKFQYFQQITPQQNNINVKINHVSKYMLCQHFKLRKNNQYFT